MARIQKQNVETPCLCGVDVPVPQIVVQSAESVVQVLVVVEQVIVRDPRGAGRGCAR